MTAPTVITGVAPVDYTADENAARCAAVVESHPDYRVLRRLVPRERYTEEPWNLGDRSAARLALYVDAETTGLDRERDEIIELALVPFTYDSVSGRVYDVQPGLSFFEEPKGPISPEITELTGITAEMVRGRRIDEAAVLPLVHHAGIVIAHNAEFDRPILERRIPVFASVHWACSQREVPWEKFGVVGAKLQNVVAGACGAFYEAHRAIDDCLAGVHALAAAEYDGRPAMNYLLESARLKTTRIWALDTPRGSNEKLKAHRPRYRWSDGSKLRKGWYTDVKSAEAEREKSWLLAEIYGALMAPIATEILTSRDRYSSRIVG